MDLDEDLSTRYRPRFQPSAAPTTSFVVHAVAGPDAGGRWLIDEARAARTLVGTGPACEIRLRDREVSRRHLVLEVEDARLRVIDLESKNGTWLASVKLREVWMTGGEVVSLGSTMLRFEHGPKPDEPLREESQLGHLIGRSREMRRLYGFIHLLAAREVAVLIEGETGTGKELVAECLHLLGPRKDAAFVVVDCATMAPSDGVLAEARGGTLLLNEIGDLDPVAQGRLVAAADGGLPARLLVATNRNLDREVQAGRLREDLYHRLAQARLEVPPLRKRRGDVALLVGHFCREVGVDPGHLPARIVDVWEEQPWPGNVRELRNAVARQIVMGDLDEPEAEGARGAEMLDPRGDWLGALLAKRPPLTTARERVLELFERRYVETMLAAHDGNVARASTAAGVGRRYFQMLKARVRPPREEM